eukprot:1443351-Lingulodinium_polyedra.AAC.1
MPRRECPLSGIDWSVSKCLSPIMSDCCTVVHACLKNGRRGVMTIRQSFKSGCTPRRAAA